MLAYQSFLSQIVKNKKESNKLLTFYRLGSKLAKIMILKKGDILLVFFMFCLFTESQILSQQHFRTYTVNDGLSSNSVLTIGMDSIGYLWVGTFYGLNRFDGQEFKQYFLD